MAIIDVQVVSELGEIKVSAQTKTYLTAPIMPAVFDESFPLLRFIDAYGDTVFNRLQIPEILPELRRLRDLATTDEQREVVSEMIMLAEESIVEPGWYLKFLGD